MWIVQGEIILIQSMFGSGETKEKSNGSQHKPYTPGLSLRNGRGCMVLRFGLGALLRESPHLVFYDRGGFGDVGH